MAAPQLANFVLETATNPGTGGFTLNGAAADRRSFAAAFPQGGSVFYFADDGSQAEWGIGTLDVTGPVTLARSTVRGSTAGTATPLNFSGTVSVYSEVPAEFLPLIGDDGLVRAGGKILADRDWIGANFVGQDGGSVQSDLFVTPATGADTSSPEIGAALGEAGALGARVALKVVTGSDGKPQGHLLFGNGAAVTVDLDISTLATQSYAQPRFGSGLIAAYYGDTSMIPAGWVLCDGTNGTPDLRGKVIIGLAAGTSLGATVGADNWTGDTAGHALTVGELPAHDHSLTHHTYYLQGSGSGAAWTSGTGDTETTGETGGGEEHSHGLSVDVRQASVALNYIMWTGTGAGGAADPGSTSTVRMAAFATTAPAASEVISMFMADSDMTVPADFAGSVASVQTAPAAAYVFSVQKNAVQIGTVTIGTDKTVAFAATATDVAAGDVITVVAPAATDSSIAGFVMTLVATIG